jgi:hypothetical protein
LPTATIDRSSAFGQSCVAARTAWSIALVACVAGFSQASSGATITVDREGEVRTIAEAARIARDDDVVEILPGEYRGDVAVWAQRRLTIRGVGDTPVLVASGRSAEGKAIWVFRNGDFVVENVAFEGARVVDRNGAGIRFERGKLTVRRCRFTDNETGVMVANFADSELVIEDSQFSHAPRDRGPLKHLLYVGRIARFTLTGSRFHQGFEGHLVKSRARENYIAYNLLYDGPEGTAAYELEFPNGGIAHVVGNVIGQSASTTNPTVVSYGAEGEYWDRNSLYLVNNTLLSDRPAGAWFLRVFSDRLPGDTEVVAVDNLTVGFGIFTLGARGRFERNFPVFASALGDPATLDFRLGAHSLLRSAGATPPVVDGRSLAPAAEFRLPFGTSPLGPHDGWTPGAFQSTDPLR